jgi:hypothetical protein
MAFEYSAFNPVVWGLFALFAVVTVAAQKIFRRKHPDYPGGRRDADQEQQ